MKRFLPVAVIVALVGAAVAVVVISSGDGEEPKQPSVEQQVTPADELPPSLRAPLGRERLGLDRVRSVKCRRAPVPPSHRPTRTATCRIQLPGTAIFAFKFAFKGGDRWQILRPVRPRVTRSLRSDETPAEVGFR